MFLALPFFLFCPGVYIQILDQILLSSGVMPYLEINKTGIYTEFSKAPKRADNYKMLALYHCAVNSNTAGGEFLVIN